MIERGEAIVGQDIVDLENRAMRILGVGALDKGYGQQHTIFNQKGIEIQASHLKPLLDKLNHARRHQLGTDAGFGTTLKLPAVKGPIRAADLTPFNNALSLIDVESLRFGMPSMTLTGNLHTLTRNSRWGPTMSIVGEVNYTWPSENEARWFFNSGGDIRLNFNHPNTSTRQDRAWNRALGRVGTVQIKANTSSANSQKGAIKGDIGYHKLTGSYQMLFDGTNIDDTFDYLDGKRPGYVYAFKDDFYIRVMKIARGFRVQVEMREQNNEINNSGTNMRTSALYATKYLRTPLIRLPTITVNKNF